MTDETTPKRHRGSFVVSPVAQHEYQVLGGIDHKTQIEAELVAREALAAAREQRLTREAARRAKKERGGR